MTGQICTLEGVDVIFKYQMEENVPAAMLSFQRSNQYMNEVREIAIN